MNGRNGRERQRHCAFDAERKLTINPSIPTAEYDCTTERKLIFKGDTRNGLDHFCWQRCFLGNEIVYGLPLYGLRTELLQMAECVHNQFGWYNRR